MHLNTATWGDMNEVKHHDLEKFVTLKDDIPFWSLRGIWKGRLSDEEANSGFDTSKNTTLL